MLGQERDFGKASAEIPVGDLAREYSQRPFGIDWRRSKRTPQKRSWAEIIASNLIELAASKSPSAVAAANEICDRAEGRPAQHLQISDFASDLQSRSDEELKFHLANGRWPSDEELVLLKQPVEPTEM
jgi:hypothetical protein